MNSKKIDLSMANSPLLVIDDNVDNIKLLEHILEWAGFTNVTTCTRAKRALELLRTFDPHLIILDLRMPEMDGFEFLEKVHAVTRKESYLPILVYTADLTPAAKIRALESGASDFLTKPGDSIEIKLKIQNFLQTRKQQGDLQNHNQILEAKVQERTEHLLISRKEAVELLARASEYRDDSTGKHARRVGEMSARLASLLKLDSEFVDSIRMAAPLHDVGKIAVPDHILHKEGKLTEEETELMKRHVATGAALIGENVSPALQMARDVVMYHHERWDGTGYLAGLAGEDIPLSARIVSVADAFDAMTNDRPYRLGMPAMQAYAEIERNSGSQFDPTIVEALGRHLKAWEWAQTKVA